jgi:hypothetical protein
MIPVCGCSAAEEWPQAQHGVVAVAASDLIPPLPGLQPDHAAPMNSHCMLKMIKQADLAH